MTRGGRNDKRGQECYNILRDNIVLNGYYCAERYGTTGEQET